MDSKYITTLNDLVEDATIYHLAVENRDHELLKKASKTELEILDRDKESVLHWAAVNDDLETCKLLLELNPDLKNIKCIEGKTALDWMKEYKSEYNSHQEICDFLSQ
jgi:ankyrin repeat protein